MAAQQFELRGEYIELCNLLKLAGLVGSGGEGKQRVAEGVVRVDGVVDTRKTAKIRAGQRVQFAGVEIEVVA